MTSTLLTADAKEALRKAVRGLRARLLEDLASAAKGEYQLDIGTDTARLSEARRGRRKRLEDWMDEQARAVGSKAGRRAELRARFLGQAVEEAAHTLLNRLVLIRILEHHALLGRSAPHVVTGGWKSPGYASEFLGYAGPLADDDSRGYRHVLDAIFAELALELPGLYGNVGLTALFPVPASTLRAVVDVLNDPALACAWGDDTTLGWVYQFWNDPEREALDAKIAGGAKVEPHEIASKTQMFTERYMVEWLLQNSLGFTWLSICKKNAWTPDVEGVLPELEARRAAWRARRDAGEVELDALMPIAPGLEADWKYYVTQPIPDDAIEKAPRSIAEVRVLDPACGSGHFLVIAFGLFAKMYEEEARHRGEAWSSAEVARRIVAENLHGIDIDARAIQIAAAALWLRARLHAPDARLSRMNLVAPSFRLAALPKDDPARTALESELATLGVPRATTTRLVDGLKGVDQLGTLLRVDREIGALLDRVEKDEGALFVHGARKQRARLEELVASFLDAHAAESDLGLRLEGEQLAAGVRFIELAKEGRYDVVVGNPPYQGLSKTTSFDYVVKNYPRGKADLYAAFLERGLELVREGGISAMVTIRGWMFLGKGELRKHLLHQHRLRLLVDLHFGAFSTMKDVSVCMSVTSREPPTTCRAIRPVTPEAVVRDFRQPARNEAGLLVPAAVFEFAPNAFAVIKGEPIVYWWTQAFLDRYACAPKLGDVAPVREGLTTGDNVRFLRRPWEPAVERVSASRAGESSARIPTDGYWVPYIKGSAGLKWVEPLSYVLLWARHGLEVKLLSEQENSNFTRTVRSERLYFSPGVAFSTTGAEFAGRAHYVKSIFGSKGRSVFGDDRANTTCLLNSTRARQIATSLNPTIDFAVGDVERLPFERIDGADRILSIIERTFREHSEAHEPSVLDARCHGPSAWSSVQAWAQRAVDRPDGAPLPPYVPGYEPPDPEASVSFAIGVAFGRFGANGEGIFQATPKSALPAGVMFVGPSDAYPDSLTHPSLVAVLAAWESFAPPSGKKPALRDWLRKDFFAYHKALYESRPIYLPLSSERKSFVAWINIHRFTAATLPTLLADHLNPVLRQLDAEIHDANAARASSDKKTAIAAGKVYDSAKRLRDELGEFIAAVTECAYRGAPPADWREVDASFSMELDDGVMINSAALWPLLEPQWSDPKKWWKQLCFPEGKKDYDWAHLAKRYFPTRVVGKCQKDPSLAVAHGCFWRYHPDKAFTWELRLQDEIRPNFTLDEPGSDEARASWQRESAADSEAAREKERVRRERKAAKQDQIDDAPERDDIGENDDD
jgi:hypothetical protein